MLSPWRDGQETARSGSSAQSSCWATARSRWAASRNAACWPRQLVLGEITVVGNLIGTNPDLTGLIALAQQGKVVLRSTGCPLDAANEVIDDLRHGRIRGRAILIP